MLVVVSRAVEEVLEELVFMPEGLVVAPERLVVAPER